MATQTEINFLPQTDLKAQSTSESKSIDVNQNISINPEQINDEPTISKSRVSNAMRTAVKRRRKTTSSTAVDSDEIDEDTKRTKKPRACKTMNEDERKKQQLTDENVNRKRKTKVKQLII